jgi:hypothetical protein
MAARLHQEGVSMAIVAGSTVWYQPGGIQMSRLWVLASSIALTLALGLPVAAQRSVTVVLRSGERISGELVDMSGSGFQLRVGGASRQVATGDVSVIDFGGGGNFPDSEVNQVPAGKHLVVLTSGQTVSGNLYDIGGANPLRISMHTDGGNRDFSSSEVRRIYLSRPGGVAAAPSATPSSPATLPATGGQIRVPANQRWTDTGITVRNGDRVTFNASGQVQLSTNPSDKAGPAGAPSGRYPSGPMPRVLAGALIGRVGPVGIFGIGSQTTPLTMPADGRLFLGINDDEVADNTGEYTVDVRPDASQLNRRR